MGIGSATPTPEQIGAIRYDEPEPPFDESKPPYDFIKNPFRLRIVELNPPWPDQMQAYKDAGFEIAHRYEEQRVDWQTEGFRPLIFKDPDLRDYVLVVFDVGSGYRKMVIGRQR